MYIFEEDRLVKDLRRRRARRVLLQLPEGLKREAVRLSLLLEKKAGVEVVVSGEPMWGACDVAMSEAKALGCDVIVLYGHAPFMKVPYPVIYLEARFESRIEPLVRKMLLLLKEYRRVGVVASVQHMHQLPLVKRLLKKAGKEVIIPLRKGHAFYDGQVLGCEYHGLRLARKRMDAVVVVANGFHALGAALSVTLPVMLVDPYARVVSDMGSLREQVVKQRFAAIEKVKSARKIGIIVGLKVGQQFGSFRYVKEKAQQVGKEAVLVAMNEVSDDKLVNLYDLDAFVEVACPRIAIEDVARFSKPVVTTREFAVVCGDLSWSELLEKGFL